SFLACRAWNSSSLLARIQFFAEYPANRLVARLQRPCYALLYGHPDMFFPVLYGHVTHRAYMDVLPIAVPVLPRLVLEHQPHGGDNQRSANSQILCRGVDHGFSGGTAALASCTAATVSLAFSSATCKDCCTASGAPCSVRNSPIRYRPIVTKLIPIISQTC